MVDVAVIVALISIGGNVIQFFLNKKSSDIKILNERVAALDKLQDVQNRTYEQVTKAQDEELGSLRKKIDEQAEMLNSNKEEIQELNRLVTKLIGEGCHIGDCPSRIGYTIEEINKFTKKNEKSITRKY